MSAPTSFGKTLLIDATIAENLPDVVVIVVPTLALLDEQRRRLSSRFGNRYQIISRVDQEIDPTLRTIFVLTQERLLERNDIEEIDLFVIDEFYKLNADPTNPRSKALNIAFQKFRTRSKQVFLLGPNVKATIPSDIIDSVTIDTDSVTVATETHDERSGRSKRKKIRRLLGELTGRKTLIFCKSPGSARKVAEKLIEDGFASETSETSEFAKWLKENYHPEWSVASALEKGIGIHHGAVPRSIGQRILRLFDEADLDVLICTSTLIEGVNTKAENIIIYDKKIERNDFDFFSYQNIRGRAGRFGHYLIGHVYLFEDPPQPESFQLSIPSLSAESEVSDEYLIGFDGFANGIQYSERREAIEEELELPASLINALARFQITEIKQAAELIEAEVERKNTQIFWTGRTEYHHLASTLNLTWRLFASRAPLVSGSQAAFYSSRLLRAHGNIKRFLAELVEDKTGTALQKELETAFRAMRSIEFHVPEVLRANELLVNHFCEKYGLETVEYQTMARMVESYFLPSNVKALEEIGIPTPIGIKLVNLIGEDETFDGMLRLVTSLRTDQLERANLSAYEQRLLKSAI